MIATYHNHSRWSDGKGEVHDLVAAAVSQGIDELGIADHYLLGPNGLTRRWSIDVNGLDRYVADVRQAAADSPIPLRLGLEVDWFTEAAESIEAALAPFDFDFLIGSVHEVGDMIIDGHPQSWIELTPSERDEVHRRYWIAMGEMASSRLFDIAGHLDLSKKLGFLPQIDLSQEIDCTLDTIANSDMVIELNTAGWHKPCRDAYPTKELLQQCRLRDIPVTISADAHDPAHLIRDFDRAAARLREAGYERITRFGPARQRWDEPLADC